MFISKAPQGALVMGAVVAAAALFSAGGANAASFSIVSENPGATSYTLTSSFNPVGWTNPNGVGVGTTITTFSANNDGCFQPGGCTIPTGLYVNPGNSNITFTYLGHEAADTDLALTANFGSITLFNNQTSSNGASNTQAFTLGGGSALLPLIFKDTTGTDVSAPNGGPIGAGVSIGFYVTPDGQTAYAFFDDKNGGHQDSDYDDIVIKITFATQGNPNPTPLPAALPLFVSGLGAMGVLGWRKKRKAAAAT